MAKLIMSLDGAVIRELPLDKERVTIGRKAHNDIQIDNLAVSGEHALIVTILNDSFLEDMGSTNGTLVNGNPVKKHILQNNDVIPYANEAAPAGTLAQVRVGEVAVPSVDGSNMDAAALAEAKAGATARISAALTAAGYPPSADPARVNAVGVFLVLLVLCIGATALYGPQAAALVELFPTRIRYTALSLPYHIGTGWVGGFLPATAFAMVAATGDIYFGLWYPVVFTAVAAVVTLIFLPETRGRDLDY